MSITLEAIKPFKRRLGLTRIFPSRGAKCIRLSVLHDKAFNAGIITVTEDMTVHVSRKHAVNADHFFNAALLAYDGKPLVLPKKFRPLAEFLSYHRQHVFER